MWTDGKNNDLEHQHSKHYHTAPELKRCKLCRKRHELNKIHKKPITPIMHYKDIEHFESKIPIDVNLCLKKIDLNNNSNNDIILKNK